MVTAACAVGAYPTMESSSDASPGLGSGDSNSGSGPMDATATADTTVSTTAGGTTTGPLSTGSEASTWTSADASASAAETSESTSSTDGSTSDESTSSSENESETGSSAGSEADTSSESSSSESTDGDSSDESSSGSSEGDESSDATSSSSSSSTGSSESSESTGLSDSTDSSDVGDASSTSDDCVPVYCIDDNAGQTHSGDVLLGDYRHGIRVDVDTDMVITRVEIFTAHSSPRTQPLELLAHDESGAIGAPLATGAMQLSSTHGYHGADYDPPLELSAGETFWIAWDGETGMPAPVAAGGTTQRTMAWENPPGQWANFTRLTLMRVTCCPP